MTRIPNWKHIFQITFALMSSALFCKCSSDLEIIWKVLFYVIFVCIRAISLYCTWSTSNRHHDSMFECTTWTPSYLTLCVILALYKHTVISISISMYQNHVCNLCILKLFFFDKLLYCVSSPGNYLMEHHPNTTIMWSRCGLLLPIAAVRNFCLCQIHIKINLVDDIKTK